MQENRRSHPKSLGFPHFEYSGEGRAEHAQRKNTANTWKHIGQQDRRHDGRVCANSGSEIPLFEFLVEGMNGRSCEGSSE